MNVRKVKEIVKFDVERNIQNKWFVILNIVLLISMLLATNWRNISSFLENQGINLLSTEEVTIQVLDSENLIFDNISEKYKDYKNLKFEKVEKNNYSKENIPKDEVILLEVKTDEEDIIQAKIVSKEGLTDEIYSIIYNEIKEVRSKVFAEKHGITLDELEILNDEPFIERELLGVDAENSDTKEMVKLVSVVVVYMVLIFMLSNIANTIAQEKVSKSIEYVLTSVTAKEYLIAKVLGVTFTILIQVLYTFVYYIIGNMVSTLVVSRTTGELVNTFENVDTSIISYVFVMSAYLIFTVFLTALIQAALSAKTTSVAEAGNTTMLLISVVVILYIISIGAISPYNKVTPFMYIISCLPLVSTFFVPSMMIIGQATILQIIISFILLILSVPLIFNICSNHFKNGILDYTSSKKKLKQKKEISFQEKQEYELRLIKAKKYAFTIGMALIIFIFLQTVLSLISQLVLQSIFENKVDSSTILNLSSLIVSVFSTLITVAFINLYADLKKEKSNFTKRQFVEYVFIGIALIGIIQVVLPIIYEKFGFNYDVLESFDVVPGSAFLDRVIYFISLAVVPAICEELLFRKVILNYSKKFGNFFAVLFSSLLFGLIHMNFGQGIFAFLIGLIFGTIAVKTNSIKITVFLHFLNNGYAVVQSLMASNSVALGIFNNIIFAILIFSIIILIKNLPKLKELNKDSFKLNKDCVLILRNYTFIVSLVLIFVMFMATENILKIS